MQDDVKKILQLALSGDETNYTLAIELMHSQGLQTELFQSVFPPADFVWVEGGSFEMGNDETKDDTQKPAHRVTLDSFYIQAAPVTQLQYQLLMGENPSKFKGCNDCPVEEVSWYSAAKFCNALSQWSGLEPVYTIDIYTEDPNNKNDDGWEKWLVLWNKQANGFRLPTEAEWEFAARGGTLSKGYRFAGGDKFGELAWHKGNAKEKTHPVKRKKPNELGLYDMTGNVMEWCWDWCNHDENYYIMGSRHNPTGSTYGATRLMRGGSWRDSSPYDLDPRHRTLNRPHFYGSDTGFRVVRN